MQIKGSSRGSPVNQWRACGGNRTKTASRAPPGEPLSRTSGTLGSAGVITGIPIQLRQTLDRSKPNVFLRIISCVTTSFTFTPQANRADRPRPRHRGRQTRPLGSA